MRRTLRASAAVVAVVAVVAVLTSCGDQEPAPTEQDDEALTIEITIEDGTVAPSGDRIDVAVGQAIELVVEADQSGEIHVHSKPEQQLDYAEGTTTLPLTIDKPGVVDVESHDPEQVIVQLEVE